MCVSDLKAALVSPANKSRPHNSISMIFFSFENVEVTFRENLKYIPLSAFAICFHNDDFIKPGHIMHYTSFVLTFM